MNRRLQQITDWSTLAKSAHFNVAALASKCLISTRQLERFFLIRYGISPHKWLRNARMHRAGELIRKNNSIKEVAAELGYKSAAHFARDFKENFGDSPSRFKQKKFAAAVADR